MFEEKKLSQIKIELKPEKESCEQREATSPGPKYWGRWLIHCEVEYHNQLIEGPKILKLLVCICCITTLRNLINRVDLIELTDSRISNMNQVLTEQVNACYFVNKTALKDNSIHVL